MKISCPAISELPEITEKDDLYICAMGFEDRSLGSNLQLQNRKFRSNHSLVLSYDVYKEQNEREKQQFENAIKKMSDSFSYIHYQMSDRLNFTKEIQEDIKAHSNKVKTITINISSLTTHALVWLSNFALDIAERVRIVYTSPKGYVAPIEQEKAFSSGVKDIFTIEEFAGAHLPGYSSLLIILLGYDLVRARGIYLQVQPSKKIGIMAEPTTPKMKSLFPKIKKEHEKSFDSDDKILVQSQFDLESLIDTLSAIRSESIETSNISLALTGTKFHTIAALLFAKKFNDIQLILSTPLEYFPRMYSRGTGKTYQLMMSKDWINQFLSDW